MGAFTPSAMRGPSPLGSRGQHWASRLLRLTGLAALTVTLSLGLGALPAQAQESLLMMMPTVKVQSVTSGLRRAAVSDGTSSGGDGLDQALQQLSLSFLSDEATIPGDVTYRVYENGAWSSDAQGGAAVGAKGEPIQAVQIQLSGEANTYYDLYYRVAANGYGWLGWASDNEVAGAPGVASLEAIQTRLVIKGDVPPSSTTSPVVEESSSPETPPADEESSNPETPSVDDGSFSSGDAELDAIIDELISTKIGRGEDALRKAFDYVAAYPYVYMDIYPEGDWSPEFAKQMYKNQGGNCYRYAALFRELARALGYKARVVSGAVPTNSNPEAAHGWCEIEIDGTVYIFDPDMAHGYAGHNFYQRTYEKPPLNYTIYERGPW